MQQYQVQTHQLSVSAAICGDGEGISWYLANQLINQNIAVDLYIPLPSPSSIFTQQNNKFDIYKDDLFHLHTTVYRYVFVLTNLSKHSYKQVQKYLETLSDFNGKIVLVVTQQEITNKQSARSSKLEKKLIQLATDKRRDVRLVKLYDVYGPLLQRKKNYTIVDQVLSQVPNQEIVIKANDQTLVFPLHVDDAVEAIIKTTFTRQIGGKVIELAGESLSALNFSYKVRHLLGDPTTRFSFKTQDKNWEYIGDQNYFTLSQKELRWTPQTSLDSGLKETLVVNKKQLTPPSQPVVEPDIVPPSPAVVSPSSVQPPSLVTIPPTPPQPSVVTTVVEQTTPQTPATPTTQPKQFSLTKRKPKQITQNKQITDTVKTPTQNSKKRSLVPRLPRPKLKHWYLPVLGIFIVTITALLIPWISLLIHGYSTVRSVSGVSRSLSQEDIGGVSAEIDRFNKRSNHLQQVFIQYQPYYRLVLNERLYKQLEGVVFITYHLGQAGSSTQLLASESTSLAQIITGQTEGDVLAHLQSAHTLINQMYHQMSLVEAELQSLPELRDFSWFGIDSKIGLLEESLSTYRGYLDDIDQLLTAAPELLGYDGRRTYLVLLQNNMELRPTGGFIGSYGLLIFEKGKLLDVQVEDVYTADGQLKGYVQPPQPIEEYLGEASWFLRDSNWDPDFPSTAETSAWFLEKTMGQKVDGVIGINLYVMQAMLEALGPIELTDYQETITAENLYERAQYQAEINFFPGSTQKRDYLGQLTRLSFQKILSGDRTLQLKILKQLLHKLEEKEITIALFQKDAQQVINQAHWSGEVVSPDCVVISTSTCISDYLGIREANVGVNKANLFVERQVQDTVTLSNKRATHQLSITYTNNSTGEVWPGGSYKNYMRLYAPSGTQFNTVTINGRLLSGEQLTLSRDHNKRILGFLVEVEPQSSVTVEVDYQLDINLGKQELVGYQYYYQKQPGTGTNNLQLEFRNDNNFEIVRTNFSGEQQVGSIRVSEQIASDKDYTIEYLHQP